MKRILYFILGMGLLNIACTTSSTKSEQWEILDSIYNIEILSEVLDSAKDEFDVDVVRLWSRNTETGETTQILQTVRDPESRGWYFADGKKFIPIPYDSVPVAQFAKIWSTNPLQLIVGGIPDMRNVYCYFIDVSSRKAFLVPANGGFYGETPEEGFMLFGSYRYVSDPEIGGRYTFFQIFNDEGELVDSLSLESHHR